MKWTDAEIEAWEAEKAAKYFDYQEHLLRQAISEAKETLGGERTKQIIAEELHNDR